MRPASDGDGAVVVPFRTEIRVHLRRDIEQVLIGVCDELGDEEFVFIQTESVRALALHLLKIADQEGLP